MDNDSHPYFIEADASGTPSDTATMLVGTAIEFDLDQKASIQRVSRPESGFLISEALAEALGDEMNAVDEATAASDPDPEPEPDLSGNKQSLAPEHDIHGEPTDVAYSDWDYADLKSAIITKGITVPDKKADTLVAALIAYDQEMAEETDETETETE